MGRLKGRFKTTNIGRRLQTHAEGKCPVHRLKSVHKALLRAEADLQPHTAWLLSNAFTLASKHCPPLYRQTN